MAGSNPGRRKDVGKGVDPRDRVGRGRDRCCQARPAEVPVTGGQRGAGCPDAVCRGKPHGTGQGTQRGEQPEPRASRTPVNPATALAEAPGNQLLVTRGTSADEHDPAAVRKATRLGHDPGAAQVTVGQWLDEWLAAKKDLRSGTVRSYEPHIRLYFKPHIGHIRLNRLRVADVASVFDAIDERNDAIVQARASGDLAQPDAAKGRRIVGPATKQRIRATLRSALGTYMKQHPGMLDVNVAALVSLPSGKRPKPLVWTGERVHAWQHDFQARIAAASASGRTLSPLDIWLSTPRPSPVMVRTPAPDQDVPHPPGRSDGTSAMVGSPSSLATPPTMRSPTRSWSRPVSAWNAWQAPSAEATHQRVVQGPPGDSSLARPLAA
jgi:hypothetical protein